MLKIVKTKLFYNAGSKNLNPLRRLQLTSNQTERLVESKEERYDTAKPFKDIPMPPGLPILGNYSWNKMERRDRKERALDYHRNWTKQLGPIYRLKVFGFEFLILTDPEDGKLLLSKDGRLPVIPAFEPIARVRKDYLKFKTVGLVGSGEQWLELRQKVQQDMMRPRSAMFYINDISNIVDEVIEKIEITKDNKNGLVVTNLLYEYALEGIGVMFIGTKLGVLQGSHYGVEMIQKVTRLFQLLMDVVRIPKFFAAYSSTFKEFVKLNEDILNMSQHHINKAIEKDKLDGSLDGTILKKLLTRCGFDSDIPKIMAADALVAGIDTTGNTAAFLLYHLASNPDKQQKLYEEILSVVGKDGIMKESLLGQMRYLKACQQESARLTPVAIGISRLTQKNMVLRGYQIPKGTFVLRVGALSSNDENIYKNADKFLPERWLRGCPEHDKDTNPYANLPFSHGPRACIGQRFAKIELYILAFKLVQTYDMSYSGPRIGINYKGIGSPNKPLNITFTKRASS